MRPLTCWLGCHEDVRVHAPHRIYLRCTVCGRETPGWRDDDPTLAKPRIVYATADARYQAAHAREHGRAVSI